MQKKIVEIKKCIECGEENNYHAKGLCTKCYSLKNRLDNIEERKLYTKQYKEKHKNDIKKTDICLICKKEKEIYCKEMCHPCYDKERLKKIAASKPPKEIIIKSNICKKCGIKADEIIKEMCRKCYCQENYKQNINKITKQHKEFVENNPSYMQEYYYKHGGGKEAEEHRLYKIEHAEKILQESIKNKKKWAKEYKQTPIAKFKMYKNNAKAGNIPFGLTFEQFVDNFWQKPDYYTGLPIETIGIDRVDNTKGYSLDNCVPCSEWANKAKLDYSCDEFINQCIKITNRFNVEHYNFISKIENNIFEYNNKEIKKIIYVKYYEYKTGAKRRGLYFGLVKDFFKQHFQNNCHYCGDKINKIGFDRIDSNKGYSLDNVVDCCEQCNRMKWILPQKEFIDMCKLVTIKHGTKIILNKEI